MSARLQGKTAVVTAAGQGIGRATAECFVREDARVIAIDRDASSLTSLERCETRVLDLRDSAGVTDFAAGLSNVDILVNCVGMVHHGKLGEASEADLDEAFQVNVITAFRMTRALLPMMVRGGGGAIVNISSVASSVIAVPDRCVYGTTKAAMVGMTKSIALDYVGQGIRCNAICPGTVQSPSLEERMSRGADPQATRNAFLARQPMGRLGQPEEIAEAALYLASPQSSFTTGTVMVVDGGWANA